MNSNKKNIINNLKIVNNQKQLKSIYSSNTKKKTILKILKLSENIVYCKPPYNYRDNLVSAKEMLNMFNFINNYYYGSCHEITFYVKYILSLFRIKSNIIHMKNNNILSHVGLEINDKKLKYFIDPTFGYYFYNNKKNILSLSEIQKSINQKKKFYCNKKISLKKFRNNDPNHFFYYKNKKNFKNSREKYLSLFEKVSVMDINQKNYKYKDMLRKQLHLKDYYFFKKTNYNWNKLLEVKKLYNGSGIVNKKVVNRDKFINFKNLILKFNCNSKKINIIDFPYGILDIRFFFKFKKTVKLKLNINSSTKTIIVEKNSYILKKIKNIFKEPIKSLKISSSSLITNYDMKIQKPFFQYENKNQ